MNIENYFKNYKNLDFGQNIDIEKLTFLINPLVDGVPQSIPILQLYNNEKNFPLINKVLDFLDNNNEFSANKKIIYETLIKKIIIQRHSIDLKNKNFFLKYSEKKPRKSSLILHHNLYIKLFEYIFKNQNILNDFNKDDDSLFDNFQINLLYFPIKEAFYNIPYNKELLENYNNLIKELQIKLIKEKINYYFNNNLFLNDKIKNYYNKDIFYDISKKGFNYYLINKSKNLKSKLNMISNKEIILTDTIIQKTIIIDNIDALVEDFNDNKSYNFDLKSQTNFLIVKEALKMSKEIEELNLFNIEKNLIENKIYIYDFINKENQKYIDNDLISYFTLFTFLSIIYPTSITYNKYFQISENLKDFFQKIEIFLHEKNCFDIEFLNVKFNFIEEILFLELCYNKKYDKYQLNEKILDKLNIKLINEFDYLINYYKNNLQKYEHNKILFTDYCFENLYKLNDCINLNNYPFSNKKYDYLKNLINNKIKLIKEDKNIEFFNLYAKNDFMVNTDNVSFEGIDLKKLSLEIISKFFITMNDNIINNENLINKLKSNVENHHLNQSLELIKKEENNNIKVKRKL